MRTRRNRRYFNARNTHSSWSSRVFDNIECTAAHPKILMLQVLDNAVPRVAGVERRRVEGGKADEGKKYYKLRVFSHTNVRPEKVIFAKRTQMPKKIKEKN